eukprot:109952_1
MTTGGEPMKDTNCSSSLSDIVTIVENDSQLASHYMTGNENFNLAEKEKSEFNYDTMGTKRLEGNESIYDESDVVVVAEDCGSNDDQQLAVSTSDDEPSCDNDSPSMEEFSDDDDSSLTCDRFGFFVDSDHAHCTADPDLSKIHERSLKWLKMGKRWSLTQKKRAQKLKRRVRKGIPDAMRCEMWQLLCGSKERMKRGGGAQYYNTLLASDDINVDGPIEEDLPRTLHDHEIFCSHSRYHGTEKLRRVLTAYGRRDREVQYCQGMNYIASLFLVYMIEEEAFWMFVTVMERPLAPLRELYLPGLIKSQEAMFVLDQLLNKFVPRLTAKLQAHGLSQSMYAYPWFVTCLTQRFPYDVVTRVWDIFLLEGWKVMYRVCIALFKHAEEDRGALKMDLENLNVFLRDLPTLVECPTLMRLIWKVPLKRQHITELMKEYSEKCLQ